ncbi:MAG: tRNA 2-thiouridine(34) synthase MnmA [Prevotella sp.]|nr:tRNA 2-thiouridine(34) synthase MnmA [Prevotella sp.]
MKKILVGMSGGVDSSVAALLLKEQGYEVSGCTLKLFDGNDDDILTRTCCSLSDVEDARSVCCKLGIDHHVFNFKDLFRTEVMDRFADGYINGETPNPCIFCNRYVKFGKMLERALLLGFDGIATGHYAKTERDEKTGRTLLIRPADRKKDQTYVLYNMTQFQLARTLFPLWDRDKEQNRTLAEQHGLVNARKPDSQDICFVPDGDYAKFIAEYTGRTFPEGDFIDLDGNVIGRHGGIIRYTVGQRKGLGVTFGKPVYVCGKDVHNNTVTLGNSEDLLTTVAVAEDVNLIAVPDISAPMRVTAKTRYNMADAAGTLERVGDSRIKVTFDVPQRAVTEGQALVVYDGDIVVGGGKII